MVLGIEFPPDCPHDDKKRWRGFTADDISLITAVGGYTDLQVQCMHRRYTMDGLHNPISCGESSANSVRITDEGKYVLLN